MSEDRRVRYILEAVTSDFDARMKTSGKVVDGLDSKLTGVGPASQKAAQATSKSATQIQGTLKRTESSFATFGKAAAGAFAAVGIASFAKDSIKAASDLSETINKSSVIFGQNAQAIEQWANDSSKNLGLSKQAALESAAALGDMFSQIGFTGSQAATQSKAVVQLATDLGSFNNLDTSDVLDRISGAFRGEYDALQKVIPNISAARVQQEAMAESGKKNAASLTAQEKATATLAIIQKDGARATGDFARTQDGLANKSKIARAEFENMKAAVGEQLLPVVSELLGAFQEILPALEAVATAGASVVKFFIGLPGPIQTAVVGLIAMRKVTGTDLFGKLTSGGGAFSKIIGGVGKYFGPVGLGIGVVASAIDGLVSKQSDAELAMAALDDRTKDLVGTLDAATGAITDLTRQQIIHAETVNGNLKFLTDLGVNTKDYIDAQLGVAGATDKVAASTKSAAQSLLASNDQYKQISPLLSGAGISAQEFADAIASGNVTDLRAKFQTAAEAAASVSGNVDDAQASLQAFDDVTAGTGDQISRLSGFAGLAGQNFGELSKAGKAQAETTRLQALANGTYVDSQDESKAAAVAMSASLKGQTSATKTQTAAELEQEEATRKAAIATTQKTSKTLLAASTQNVLRDANAATAAQVELARAAYDKAVGALTPMEAAASKAAEAQDRLDEATGRIVTRLDALAGRVPTVEQAMADLNQATDDFAKAAIGGEDGTNAFTGALVKANGEIDTSNQAGRDLRDNLLDVRDKTVLAAKAAFEQAGGMKNVAAATDAANKVVTDSRTAFVNAAVASGKSQEAAEKMADAYGLIPADVSTTIKADDKEALEKTKNVKTKLDELNRLVSKPTLDATDYATAKVAAVAEAIAAFKDKNVTLTVQQVNLLQGVADAVRIPSGDPAGDARFATGGFVSGPGTGTSDSIDARLSDGEFVVRAAQTAKHLPLLKAINDGAPGFATGGLVNVDMRAPGLSGSGATSLWRQLYEAADKGAAASQVEIAAAAAAAAASAVVGGVNSGLLGNQDPSSFGWTRAQGIEPYAYGGHSILGGVAGGTQSLWDQLLGRVVPLIKGGLTGEQYGFEDRNNVNSPGNASFHSYGLAVDLNAPYNGNGTNPGSGQFQLPPATGAIARALGFLWGGEFSGTKDPMHLEMHRAKEGMASPGGSTGAPAGGAAGVQQWAALMTQALQMTGQYSPGNLAAGLHQMDTESSGNPLAINLTDSNAQRGTPSKGLMQVIDPTFQSYAQAGYNSDIYDPLSNILASINYTLDAYGSLANGWRGVAYAGGGSVSGPGSSSSDSILARLSNGEFVVNAPAAERHGALLRAINAGSLPGFAAGGPVLPNIGGVSEPQRGSREGAIFQGDQALLQYLRDLGSAASGAAAQAKDSAATLTAAENDVAIARDAQAHLAKKATTEEKLRARHAVEDAVRRQTAARRQADADATVAKSSKALYDAQRKQFGDFTRERASLATNARRFDTLLSRRDSTQGLLNSALQDRASAIDSRASGFASIGGGPLAFAGQRSTPGSLIKGLNDRLMKTKAYGKNISILQGFGLKSGSLFDELTSGSDDAISQAALYARSGRGVVQQASRINAQTDAAAQRMATIIEAGRNPYIAHLQTALDTQNKNIDRVVDRMDHFDQVISRGFRGAMNDLVDAHETSRSSR